LVDQAQGDAGVGETVHKVGRAVFGGARPDSDPGEANQSCCAGMFGDNPPTPGNVDVPMGSTQNVGVSVSGGRVPEEYDSSPML